MNDIQTEANNVCHETSSFAASSSSSNNLANLLVSPEETPIKSVLRRSARRRTLAPIYNSQLNADDDKSMASSSSKRKQKEVILNSEATAPRSKKNKGNKKNPRRRSLAVQNGQLLVGQNKMVDSSQSSISSSSNCTMSSLSNISRSDSISVFSKEEEVESINDESQHSSSTLSRICNGISAMMDEKISPKRKKTAKGRKGTPAPKRRSARIRKSMLPPARQVTDEDAKEHAGDDNQSGLSCKFRLSTYSPLDKSHVEKKSDYKDTKNRTGDDDKSELCCKFRLSTYSPLGKDHDDDSSEQEDTNKEDGTGDNGESGLLNKFQPSSHSPLEKDEDDNGSNLDGMNESSLNFKMDVIKGSLTEQHSTQQHQDEKKCESKRELNKDNTGMSNQIHFGTDSPLVDLAMNKTDSVIPENDSSTKKIAKKARRRRRSSLGLHIGGMVNLSDIEAAQKVAAATRRRRKSVVQSLPQETFNNINSSNDKEIEKSDPKTYDSITRTRVENEQTEEVGDILQHSQTSLYESHFDSSINPSSAEVRKEKIPTDTVHNVDLPKEDESICNSSTQETKRANDTKEYIEDDKSGQGIQMPEPEGPNSAGQTLNHETYENICRNHTGISMKTNDLMVESRTNKNENVDMPILAIVSSAPPKSLSSLEISSRDIKKMMRKLCEGIPIDNTPSMTPRLFGSVLFRLQKQDYTSDQISKVFPLLKAFIFAELASLKDLNISNETSRKKLHFCSFDYSSTITPIDTMLESIEIIESCIFKLRDIIDEEIILSKANSETMNLICSFINCLEDLCKEEDLKTFSECSKVMPFDWPKSRFKSAAEVYANELSYTKSMLKPDDIVRHHSFVRKSLGDFIGRAIRFYLRKFFNPVPLALHSDGNDTPDYSKCRSRVHEIVEMKDDEDNGHDTATADGSISSVIGIALERMIKFFDLNCEMVTREGYKNENEYCTTFFQRPASLGGLIERGCVIELSESDVSEILLDIEECNIALAGVRACRFIKNLLTWPGVSEAISEVGGWEKVQCLATLFRKHNLCEEMPAEDHFILLSDVHALVKKIQSDEGALNLVEKNCEDHSRKIWKRFRCGTRNKDLLQLNPCIKTFQNELKEAKQTILPSLTNATIWE